jgi:hypothetical protein
MITDAMEMMENRETVLDPADKEFVFQFAFQTGDRELTRKLIGELAEKDADAGRIKRKYQQLGDKKPAWVEKIENLLVALEMYRIEEEKAIFRITEFLRMNGVVVTEETVKQSDIGELRSMVSGAVAVETRERAVL